jgi:hypothetical protein
MPNPGISPAEQERRMAVTQRLMGTGFGWGARAAKELGMQRVTYRSWLRANGIEADGPEAQVADGFMLKGYSEFTKTEHGTPIWLKTVKAEQDYWEGVADAIRDLKPVAQVELPTGLPDGDIIPWLQIGDAHIGMLASEAETGANFDISIGEREICAAAAALIDSAPPCRRMVINDLGDATHYETFKGETEASGHALDYDTRYWKMIRAYIRITRFIIERALAKAEVVDYICNQGNHSRSNDIWIAATVDALYGETGRVNVLKNESPFIAYRMGKTLVVIHHGDKAKPEKFRDIVVSDFAADWGETDFHYLDGGHVHHSQRKELAGCIFESWNNLAPRDKYAHDGGWRSKACMSLVLRSRTYGEIGRHVMPIERVRDLILATGVTHYVPPPMRAFAA